MINREAVAAIVKSEGDILIGKKKITEGKWFSGKWHLPGETKNEGESDEEALRRGLKEEVDIDILVIRYLAEHLSPMGTRVRWYECRAESRHLCPSSDLDEAKWVSEGDVVSVLEPEIVSLWPEEVKRFFHLIG